MKMTKRTDKALAFLIHAIRVEGREFPDACGTAARVFRVSYDRLRNAYDEYEGRRGREIRTIDLRGDRDGYAR